jgi:hypothetical protein
MRRHLTLAAALGLAAAFPGTAAAQDKGSPNLDHLKTIAYPAKVAGQNPNHGTDVEFATLRGRKYAFAGSYYNGLRIVDVTRPEEARTASVYNCPIRQGDVQVFKAADRSGRTLVTYTADLTENAKVAATGCFEDAERKGFDARTDTGTGRQGTFIVDVSNPAKPKLVSFIEVKQGSHNQTVHPSGGWLYNSNSDLITSTSPAIEIIDIRDPDVPVKKGELPLQARPGLGTESHDITFNDAGTRAYSAALSHGVIIDTTNPGEAQDDHHVRRRGDQRLAPDRPVHDHQGRTAPSGTSSSPRTSSPALRAANVCPSGGVHVYDVTGAKEKAPEKVGYWNIEDVQVTGADPEETCTAHVFDVHEDEQLMTIAFYRGGVRVVDLAGLATGKGLKAIASFQTGNANTWSFKAPTVSRDGVFHAYGNDINRGLDVYRYDGSKAQTTKPGTWVPGPALDSGPVGVGGAKSATDVVGAATARSGGVSLAGYRMNCLLK